MIDDLLSDARERMDKSVASTKGEFATVRTGRATPHLLDRVHVDYYGTQTPLAQLASIAATEARMLTVTPYEKSPYAKRSSCRRRGESGSDCRRGWPRRAGIRRP